MKRSKRKYIAQGILVSFVFSLISEGYFFTQGQDKFFERSLSGLKYSYIFLPVFLVLGYMGGYFYWLLFVKKKGEDL
jgi:hypothetical protein